MASKSVRRRENQKARLLAAQAQAKSTSGVGPRQQPKPASRPLQAKSTVEVRKRPPSTPSQASSSSSGSEPEFAGFSPAAPANEEAIQPLAESSDDAVVPSVRRVLFAEPASKRHNLRPRGPKALQATPAEQDIEDIEDLAPANESLSASPSPPAPAIEAGRQQATQDLLRSAAEETKPDWCQRCLRALQAISGARAASTGEPAAVAGCDMEEGSCARCSHVKHTCEEVPKQAWAPANFLVWLGRGLPRPWTEDMRNAVAQQARGLDRLIKKINKDAKGAPASDPLMRELLDSTNDIRDILAQAHNVRVPVRVPQQANLIDEVLYGRVEAQVARARAVVAAGRARASDA